MNKQEAFEALREAQMAELEARDRLSKARAEVSRAERLLNVADIDLEKAEKNFLSKSGNDDE